MLFLSDFADITTIAVAQDFRRMGIGSDMVKLMMSHASQRGAGRMLLEVRCTNQSAIDFYQTFGFEVIAQRPNYYGPGLDAFVMELDQLPEVRDV